jgi:TctA family transporter
MRSSCGSEMIWLFVKFPTERVKAELVVPYILLISSIHVYGWDVQVFDVVYSGSSCGVSGITRATTACFG